MSENRGSIPTPLPLRFRRIRYQIVPIVTLIVSATLAGWIWARQTHQGYGVGEVSEVRIDLDAKFDGVLMDKPLPAVFDSVKAGQVVARIETSEEQAELARLEQELARMTGPSTSPAQGGDTYSLMRWYHTRMDELRQRIKEADLTSPIDGTITRIQKNSGEHVKLGTTILTVGADHAQFIIGYLRPNQSVRPSTGMVVEVRPRSALSPSFRTFIQSVGPGYEPLPPHMLFTPTVPERALAIQIALPSDSKLKPGELIDFSLKPDEK
jgi:multidrug resistance efflux pump